MYKLGFLKSSFLVRRIQIFIWVPEQYLKKLFLGLVAAMILLRYSTFSAKQVECPNPWVQGFTYSYECVAMNHGLLILQQILLMCQCIQFNYLSSLSFFRSVYMLFVQHMYNKYPVFGILFASYLKCFSVN